MLEGFKEINSRVQHSEKQANNQTKNPQNSGGKSFKTTPSGDSNTAQKSKENPHYIEIHIKQRRTKVLNSWAIADAVQGTLYPSQNTAWLQMGNPRSNNCIAGAWSSAGCSEATSSPRGTLLQGKAPGGTMQLCRDSGDAADKQAYSHGKY